ncbi:TPA: hypothetical protein DCE37_12960 [Candidatus Latescibacteria bacterium]|nr:hypothetical protein [Candidatus Latescibacterota bacterium]
MTTEIEEILIGLILVGALLTGKVIRDGLREIERFRGVIAYTAKETARYSREREEAETQADATRDLVSGLKQKVLSLEQRTTTLWRGRKGGFREGAGDGAESAGWVGGCTPEVWRWVLLSHIVGDSPSR